MMNILESVGRTTKNVLLLGLLCLVVEQAIYCVLIPGYFFSLMLSPVFWGSVSVTCFSLLRWMDRVYPEETAANTKRNDTGWHPAWNNPVNPCSAWYIFSHSGE